MLCDIGLFDLSRNVFIGSNSGKQEVLREKKHFSYLSDATMYMQSPSPICLRRGAFLLRPSNPQLDWGRREALVEHAWANMSLYDSCHLGLTQAEHTAAFAQQSRKIRDIYAKLRLTQRHDQHVTRTLIL